MQFELTALDGTKLNIDEEKISAVGSNDVDGKPVNFIVYEGKKVKVKEDYFTIQKLRATS